jgi:acetyl-CoA C-acetyltransferase
MQPNTTPVYVVDGARTPYLKARNGPGAFTATDLCVAAGKSLLLRQPFDANAFDEVVLGSTMAGPDEPNIARVAALRLGCGHRVPAYTVHRNCASGMQALDSAASSIASGRAHLILAGGVDAMSHAPVLFSTAMTRWLAAWWSARSMGARVKTLSQLRLGHLAPVIGLLRGLTDPVVGLNMGQTAEKIAYRFGITREHMDAFAVRSHQRLASAQANRHMNEVEPLFGPDGTVYQHDDGVRTDSSMENLAKLKPVFDKPFGLVTAGNSAQVTDGAAWLILASAQAVKRYNLPVLGRFVSCHWAALDPAEMGLGPAHAIPGLLSPHNLTANDIDYWEINEAFAAQVLACLAALRDENYCREHIGLTHAWGDINQDRLNIDGGGISLGHPVGSSGARIVLHLLHVLARHQAKRGVASLCIGGGQGGAVLVERD